MIFEDIVDYVLSEVRAPFVEEVTASVTRARAARVQIAKGNFTVSTIKMDAVHGESGVGDFLDHEEILAAIMQTAWSRKAQKARDAMVSVLSTGTVSKAEGDSWTPARMDAAVLAAAALMGDLVTKEDEVRMLATFKQSARRAAALVNGLQALDQYPRFETIMQGMVRSSRYFTNNYFNTQVVPSLYRAVENIVADPQLTEAARVYQSVRQAIDTRLLQRVPYWHTVSSGAASRAYHYGVIKAGRSMGYRGYRLVAVRDAKTSDICIHLDGKEFWLADAEAIYDRIADAEDDAIKDVHPWLTEEQAIGLSEQEVYNRAAVVPPFHGRCRTTMQLLSV